MSLEEYLDAATDAAVQAGQFLKENLDESRKITFKGEVDLVTNFDNRCQEMIFDHLVSRFPDHDFLAEEGLCEDKGGEFRWIIDPLDGTTNYTHRFPVFCLESGVKMVLGVVYDPMREELFTAIEGRASSLNGRVIQVSPVVELDKSLLSTGFPYDVRESSVNNLIHFSNFAIRAQAVRRCGSAAMDLCYVACGRFDGFWELKLHPWDIAAASLIVKQAGGQLSDFQNGEFSVYGSETLATNGLIHQQMIEVLQMGRREESSGNGHDE
jgi:myo-inositol-1(or 4)-monophosphatase